MRAGLWTVGGANRKLCVTYPEGSGGDCGFGGDKSREAAAAGKGRRYKQT